MSFDALFTSIYQLYYKADVRQRFFESGELDADLSEAERAALRGIDPERLARIVDLHGTDIWAGWYAERFGATWEALRSLLGLKENRELVARLCASDAFELRVNDDRSGAALAGSIAEERERGAIQESAWLEELFDYEALLSAEFGDDFRAYLGAFEHRVDQLVGRTRPWRGLPSEKNIAKPYRVLIGVSPVIGLSEIEISSPLCFGVLSRMLDAGREEEALIESAKRDEVEALEEECEELLEEMAEG